MQEDKYGRQLIDAIEKAGGTIEPRGSNKMKVNGPNGSSWAGYRIPNETSLRHTMARVAKMTGLEFDR